MPSVTKHAKDASSAVYQVIRDTRGNIQHIHRLQSTKTAWGVYRVCPTGSHHVLTFRMGSARRGRPTVLPNQLIQVAATPGRPPRGTYHVYSPELNTEITRLQALGYLRKHPRQVLSDTTVLEAVANYMIKEAHHG